LRINRLQLKKTEKSLKADACIDRYFSISGIHVNYSNIHEVTSCQKLRRVYS